MTINYSEESFAFPKPDLHEEPTPAEKRELREQVWLDQKGRCNRCNVATCLSGDPWWQMQLHHKRGGIHRKNWGRNNVEGLCLGCHDKEHNPKAVPEKERS